jgi:hypothetical protein
MGPFRQAQALLIEDRGREWATTVGGGQLQPAAYPAASQPALAAIPTQTQSIPKKDALLGGAALLAIVKAQPQKKDRIFFCSLSPTSGFRQGATERI